MKLKNLINPELLSENTASDYDYLIGKSFKLNGNTYAIKDFTEGKSKLILTTSSGKQFDVNELIKNGAVFAGGQPPVYTKTSNPVNSIISPSKYYSILRGAVKDAGGNEFSYDMAQSMIHDTEIYRRLKKDHPGVSDKQLVRILAGDLESA